MPRKPGSKTKTRFDRAAGYSYCVDCKRDGDHLVRVEWRKIHDKQHLVNTDDGTLHTPCRSKVCSPHEGSCKYDTWKPAGAPRTPDVNPLIDQTPKYQPAVVAPEVPDHVIQTVCSERLNGERCILELGHDGKHETQSGQLWQRLQEAKQPWDPQKELKGIVRGEMVAILDEYAIKPAPQEIVVKAPGKPDKAVSGIAHPLLARLILLLARKTHVYLGGPAGSGKTYGAGQAAAAVGLRSAVLPMPGIQSPSRLFGFEDAGGRFITTVFADFFENGGVLILDEFDRMIPMVAAALNAPLENGRAVFGGREIEAHPDFVVVANGNTDMRGATLDYTASQPLDYATVARFAFLEWGYDEATELALVSRVIGNGPAKILCDYMVALRGVVHRLSLDKLLCGPRESLRVAEDLLAGATMTEAFDSWVRRGLDNTAWTGLLREAGKLPTIKVKK